MIFIKKQKTVSSSVIIWRLYVISNAKLFFQARVGHHKRLINQRLIIYRSLKTIWIVLLYIVVTRAATVRTSSYGLYARVERWWLLRWLQISVEEFKAPTPTNFSIFATKRNISIFLSTFRPTNFNSHKPIYYLVWLLFLL